MNTNRPECPKCNKKMVAAYIQPRIEGKLKNLKIGHFCRKCKFFEPIDEE